MPSSLMGNPLAFLQGAGGSVAPPGPTAMGGQPQGPDAGGGDMSGVGGGMPDQGPLPPELMQMALASQIAPQIFAQQQQDYYKKFLKQIATVLREFMRTRGI